MTICVVTKVGDGVVLGADSAATLGDGESIQNVFFNAEKVINLRKVYPIGAVTFGLGGMDGRSITSLAKDLRRELTDGPRELKPGWSVRDVAEHVCDFLYTNLYRVEFGAPLKDGEDGNRPGMGMMVAGYSDGKTKPEVWSVEIDSRGHCAGPQCLADGSVNSQVWAEGWPEAVFRIFKGWSPRVAEAMVQSGLEPAEVRRFLESIPMEPLIHPAMPIQDAIDLTTFMIETTCGFVRFAPGGPIVAPPIDVAAITRHEGFRWVKRKHYYTRDLNP